jgi:hypothetical protein
MRSLETSPQRREAIHTHCLAELKPCSVAEGQGKERKDDRDRALNGIQPSGAAATEYAGR